MKSQAALEYLFIVGIALIILVPLFYYSLTYSSDNFIVAQASQAVESVAKAVDYVYTLGPNSKTYVWVYIPNSVNKTFVGNKTILLQVMTSAGFTDIFSNTKANVSGSFPKLEGRYYIIVNYTDQNYINIIQ